MTSITVSDIEVAATPVQLVKFRGSGRLTTRLATPLQGPNAASHKDGDPVISLYQPTSGTAFDPRCRYSLLLSTSETSRNPLFHQACIYVPEHDELYVTSGLLQTTSSSALPVVLISRVNLRRRGKPESSGGQWDEDDDDPVGGSDDDVISVEWQKLRPPQSMAMPAGGVRYGGGGSGSMVFCSQGSLGEESTGGLYFMRRGKPPEALVAGFYGRRFNSPHDVAVSSRDGALWFTDPCEGFEQGFRPRPLLPCRVYRFHPESDDLRVVADGLARPGGIAFSGDESTVYITDAGVAEGEGEGGVGPPRESAIYAFDVVTRSGSPFLANKRVFAVPTTGIPTSVRCGANDFVYAGCSGGIEIWNSGGMLQAVVEIPGGVTSFCFGRQDDTRRELFVCAEQRLWRLRFGCRSKSILPFERAGWFEWSDRTALVTAMQRPSA
ncbi:hypothetical protein KVR01_003138 [Diaporthe batatas]|uniref:uncharacterized protein n=1 Tax=Diaporthe batatas TaxID=748121 RepID=UPI001D04923F|nr:uncharacterized protein KVR01_003138 [Diaporthe batatas]KAG8167449.1 hypothetical protein KVR01_003138 [Diaporthe batatas]